ncbi:MULTISPECIES: maltokinase N-terminal cap-like domain-containing protein [unclassified Streptomyces]|uniref:maltokinase N-terminal cap-like domain-containing protein n=1 Tax=unclassified Streptomyces TaxID=2593676 RepID=UPI0022B745B2|nr:MULTISPECIES: 1,4-alpha-glucan branching protein [unclassified Streptomyces]MCZ7414167.1 1,4-alpha-glucan branching protein [Streptomyces sp. WMMC897]MCZ7431185.1 1,4-alpha-glucan branching protein [Streptomyces sp. WMMC1477]
MSLIHKTTLTPTKVDLLANWLPAQPWFVPQGAGPELTTSGGFRLDDPQGEVGIEFLVVTDTAGARPRSYHVPLTYRGAPLEGAEKALVGTAEHGVLGRRWVYDGAHDPLVVSQVLAFLHGRAEAQQQRVSHTPDPSVGRHLAPDTPEVEAPAEPAISSGPDGTDIALGPLVLTVARLLDPAAEDEEAVGRVVSRWETPHGAHRAPFFVLRRR